MIFNSRIFLHFILQIVAIHAGGDGECVAGSNEGCIDGAPDAKYCPPGEPYVPPKKFDIPPGWKGGFAESNPAFAYPQLLPDVSSLPVTTNLANIDKITRQMKTEWPQFSWQMIPGDESSRTYEKFAENVSRAGYDNEGRMWAVICPQQGLYMGKLGELNVEVTVTGVRGWMDETARSAGFQMGVMGQIWLTEDSIHKPLVRVLKNFMFKYLNDKDGFPLSKSKSIRVKTYEPGNPMQPLFWVTDGMSKDFRAPAFTQHWDGVYMVISLNVEIGEIISDDNELPIVKDFNQLFLDVFNLVKGNMLLNKNILSWNIWLSGPEVVNQTEWAAHAEKWRTSLDVHHVDPNGKSGMGAQQMYDGTVVKSALLDPKFDEKEAALYKAFFEKYHDKAEVKKRIKDKKDPLTQEDYNILKETGWLKDMM